MSSISRNLPQDYGCYHASRSDNAPICQQILRFYRGSSSWVFPHAKYRHWALIDPFFASLFVFTFWRLRSRLQSDTRDIKSWDYRPAPKSTGSTFRLDIFLFKTLNQLLLPLIQINLFIIFILYPRFFFNAIIFILTLSWSAYLIIISMIPWYE